MAAVQTFTLNTGGKIPAIGFGTWKSPPGEVATAVEAAFEAGYRHFVCLWLVLTFDRFYFVLITY